MSENTNNETTAEVKESAPVVEPIETKIKPEPAKAKPEPVKVEAPAETVVPEVTPVAEVVELKSEVIEAPNATEKPGIGAVGNGAMGVTTFKEEKKESVKKTASKKEDTVAIHSTRNVTWQGVGKVYIGYNLVSKAAADQWLTRSHTRIATPEEIAKEYGL